MSFCSRLTSPPRRARISSHAATRSLVACSSDFAISDLKLSTSALALAARSALLRRVSCISSLASSISLRCRAISLASAPDVLITESSSSFNLDSVMVFSSRTVNSELVRVSISSPMSFFMLAWASVSTSSSKTLALSCVSRLLLRVCMVDSSDRKSATSLWSCAMCSELLALIDTRAFSAFIRSLSDKSSLDCRMPLALSIMAS
mmetsp:Transcript_45684/g.87356  ORF Transcript_45684/g.87356 Transcript_45684/m.87356 type:complete len:205 (-) Transcript_45684:807-1421(-)